ncbi:MAG: glycosyltransferase family 39 protein [archaeon]|jgi:hypothetical protein
MIKQWFKEISNLKRLFERNAFVFVFIILLISSLFFALLQISKPFTADEYWYLDTAKFVALGQKPMTDFCANLPPILFEGHPTTYINYLAFFLSIAPEKFLRLSGIIIFIATLIVLFFAFRSLFGDNKLALAGTALYAFNPLAIQGSLLLDIDNTILALAIAIFSLVYLYKFKSKKIKYLFLAIAIALILLSKLTVFFIILGGAFLYFIIWKRKEFKSFVLAAFAGVGIFAIVWFVISLISGISFYSPIEYILANIFSRNATLTIYDRIVTIFYSGLKQNLLWITLPLCLLFLSQIKEKTTRLFFVISIIALAQYLFSIPSAYRFPKYMAAFLPMIALVGFYFLRNFKFKIKIASIGLFVLPSIVYAVFLRDPIQHARDLIGAVYIVVVNCIPLFPIIVSKHKKEILIFLYLGVCLYTNIFQLTTTSATLYDYGETGLQGTLEYIQQNVPQGSNIFTQGKEVAYYTNTKTYCPQTEDLNLELKTACIKAVVVKAGWGVRSNSNIISIAEQQNLEKKIFGDYTVYKTNFCGEK